MFTKVHLSNKTNYLNNNKLRMVSKSQAIGLINIRQNVGIFYEYIFEFSLKHI